MPTGADDLRNRLDERQPIEGRRYRRTIFTEKFGEQHRTVRDYYLPRRNFGAIEDVSRFVPELAALVQAAEGEPE